MFTSPANPAIVKTKKANGISQYLLRLCVLRARRAITRKMADRPRRKASYQSPVGMSETLARYAKAAARHRTTRPSREAMRIGSVASSSVALESPAGRDRGPDAAAKSLPITPPHLPYYLRYAVPYTRGAGCQDPSSSATGLVEPRAGGRSGLDPRRPGRPRSPEHAEPGPPPRVRRDDDLRVCRQQGRPARCDRAAGPARPETAP